MNIQWGENPTCKSILPEYPRPQLCRNSYLNLNGQWEYSITTFEAAPPQHYEGKIQVPFSPESTLSGVNRTLQPDQALWYRRSLCLPDSFVPVGGHILLHIGAADQKATIFINEKQAVTHTGGYTNFTADITDLLSDKNTLVIRIVDTTDAGTHSRGKQKRKRGEIWYTPQSGLWQTVWLEAVPAVYIKSLHIIPHALEGQLELLVQSTECGECQVDIFPPVCAVQKSSNNNSLDFGVEPIAAGERLLTCTIRTGVSTLITLPDPQLWCPEAPNLYPFKVSFCSDEVHSYFGLRDICVQPDSKGIKRLFLNGRPYFQNGLLDQGYWPDGLYTAPTDQALLFDIQTAKELGFNMLRKHIKVEAARWYYHCDRLGMLVWQDMVNGGGEYRFSVINVPLFLPLHRKDHHYKIFGRQDAEGRAQFLMETKEMICQLRNHPSVVLWVPFNEGWGQFDAAHIVECIQQLDTTRPIDHASGWHDQRIGSIQSKHVYFRPYRFRRDRLGRAVVLSEFGGYNLGIAGHTFSDVDYGYRRLKNPDAFWKAYQKLYEQQILPAIPKGLCAAVFTQLCDVEEELNGIMTYDRQVLKLPKQKVKQLNQRLMDTYHE